MVQVNMLWANRTHSPDELELLEAWDEYSVDNNPDGWAEVQKKALDSLEGELLNHRVIVIDIPYEAILTSLSPPLPRLAVSWLNEKEMTG